MFGTFLRSLSIHSSWNFWRMQNVGFAFAMIPTIRKRTGDREETAAMLTRHLQLFNTHPYMSGAIIGSVVRLEESGNGDPAAIESLKRTLMAPYAAMGDSLFWGSLKPFCAVLAVFLALQGFLLAPAAFLLVYSPLHFLVRYRGFREGYKQGRGAIDFIRKLNLPETARRFRWMSVVLLGAFAAFAAGVSLPPPAEYGAGYGVLGRLPLFGAALFCFALVRRGIPVLAILYGAAILLFLTILLMKW